MDSEKQMLSALHSDLISKKSLLSKMDPLYRKKKNIVPDNLAEGFAQVEGLIKWEPSPFEGMTLREVISPFLPEEAHLSVDKNGYVHIRGIKGEQLDAPYESFRDSKDGK